MKRAERSEYIYIKNTLKTMNLTASTSLTIRTDATHEFKQALHELYTALGFHPAAVKVDPRFFDEKERIIYIKGLTWGENNDHSWTELYSKSEHARLAAALN